MLRQPIQTGAGVSMNKANVTALFKVVQLHMTADFVGLSETRCGNERIVQGVDYQCWDSDVR